MKSQAIRFLIIAGKPGNWDSFRNEMQNTGMVIHVTKVQNLAEARAKLKEQTSYGMVLTDYILSDGVCTEIVPFIGSIPYIVMVEEGNEDAALTSLKSGAVDYIIKDRRQTYIKILPIAINKALEQKNQSVELLKYRTELENIVEERTIELIDMYSKLQQSEINFRNVFNSSSDCMIITDYEINFVEANNTMLKILGVTKDYLSSHSLYELIAPEQKSKAEERKNDLSLWLNNTFEIDLVSPSAGNIIPFEVCSVPIVFNNRNVILSVLRNLSERKNLERKLFETIILTEEEERTRIARDLHDEIGPLISALKIYTNTFLESSNEEKREKLARHMGEIVREVLDAIKVISNDMSPHVLVNFGLAAAIQNFIELLSKNPVIRFSSNLANSRFATTIESLIYRIIKELINNTIKHARASEILINIEYSNNAIHCKYFDNGIGFDWKKQLQYPSKGMGINNIITRIKSLGGDFEVHTEPQKGFEFSFILQTTTRNVNY